MHRVEKYVSESDTSMPMLTSMPVKIPDVIDVATPGKVVRAYSVLHGNENIQPV